MANRRHTELSEVLGGQLGQDCLIDRVVPECLLVAFQAEAAQPDTDIHGIHTHAWTHSSSGYSRRHVGRYVSRAPSAEPPADQPWHQNEVASLPHALARNRFFWFVQNENPRTNERARNPKRTALSLTIPATLLALADEVMSEKATSVVGTCRT
jgi:hypothetical protein